MKRFVCCLLPLLLTLGCKSGTPAPLSPDAAQPAFGPSPVASSSATSPSTSATVPVNTASPATASPAEASALAALVEGHRKALETADLAERVAKLEEFKGL